MPINKNRKTSDCWISGTPKFHLIAYAFSGGGVLGEACGVVWVSELSFFTVGASADLEAGILMLEARCSGGDRTARGVAVSGCAWLCANRK